MHCQCGGCNLLPRLICNLLPRLICNLLPRLICNLLPRRGVILRSSAADTRAGCGYPGQDTKDLAHRAGCLLPEVVDGLKGQKKRVRRQPRGTTPATAPQRPRVADQGETCDSQRPPTARLPGDPTVGISKPNPTSHLLRHLPFPSSLPVTLRSSHARRSRLSSFESKSDPGRRPSAS
jgi:hypothetical protein